MSEREKAIREAIEILKKIWRDEYDEAGRPLDYCPDESLHFVIGQLEDLL